LIHKGGPYGTPGIEENREYTIWFYHTNQNLIFSDTNAPNNLDDHFSSLVTLNDWFFVAVVADKSEHFSRIYINGNYTEKLDSDSFFRNNNYDLRIGWSEEGIGPWNGYYPFTGAIDEVRIYKRALSEDEIHALYNQ